MILERAIVGDAGFAEMPGKVDFLAVMRPEEFNVAFFQIAEETALVKNGLDILCQVFDRVFEGMDPVVQVLFPVRKSVRPLGRADQLMHENKVVGAAVGFFLGLEEFQSLFKFREQGIGFFP